MLRENWERAIFWDIAATYRKPLFQTYQLNILVTSEFIHPTVTHASFKDQK